MITLTDANRAALERARERAQKEHLTITEGEVNLDGGSYYVSGSKGGNYFVTIIPLGNGKYDSDCNCEAGRPTRSDHLPLICKHCYLALSSFQAFEARARSAGIITLCDCGNQIQPDQQICDECVEQMHEWHLEIEQEHAERPRQAYGPFSGKNPPKCVYCGHAHIEKPGYEALALYENGYAHQACQQKADRKAKKPCTCNRQSCSECNPVYCSICGHSHPDNIAACPGCGYRYY